MTPWSAITTAGRPVLSLLAHARAAAGREDAGRLPERFGIASLPRPEGPILWLHAASAGEATALVTLAKGLREVGWTGGILATTFTPAGAEVVAQDAELIHQYLPWDVDAWIDAFLDHWQPDVAVMVVSEVWPNLLARLEARGVPRAMVSATISTSTARRWASLGAAGGEPWSRFDRVLAADPVHALRLQPLCSRVEVGGNLKAASEPLPEDPALVQLLRAAGRPILLGASTHPGEERLLVDVRADLAERGLDPLLVLAPRHPRRGDAIARDLGPLPRRSLGDAPNGPVYLCDSLGELGSLYRAADVAVIGGSFVPVGGHNPLEAAWFDVAITIGPHHASNGDLVEALEEAGGLVVAADRAALTAQLRAWFSDPTPRAAAASAAAAVAGRHHSVRRHVARRVLGLLPS